MPDYLVAQDNEDAQVLRVDYSGRYVQNASDDWQFLFNSNSVLTPNILVLKNAGQFDTTDLDSVKVAAYLYNTSNGTIANAASCQFNIYLVSAAGWTETLLGTFSGVQQPNQYFYTDIPVTGALSPASLDGDSSLMIECVMTRLTQTFRDRIYLNHLGSYGSIVRLRSSVDFLDISKQDI